MNYYLVHGVTRTGGKLHAREIGEYWNFDEAVGVARQTIDDFLYREYQRAVWHGVTPQKLLTLYKKAGETPQLDFRAAFRPSGICRGQMRGNLRQSGAAVATNAFETTLTKA